MARLLFGGRAQDFVYRTQAATALMVAGPGVSVTFWTAQSGGTQVTDLTDLAGNPVTTVVTDAQGLLPQFYGPDSAGSQASSQAQVWASIAGGNRVLVQAQQATPRIVPGTATTLPHGSQATSVFSSGTGTPTDPYVWNVGVGAGADGAPGGSDAAQAAWIADTASQTRAELDKTYPRVFKPEQFGAVTGDATAAVVACFNAANATAIAGIGGNIWHPGAVVVLEHTYALSTLAAPIVVSCNVQGAGAAFTTPSTYAQSVLLVGHPTAKNVLHNAEISLPNLLGDAPATAHTVGSVGATVQNLTHSRLRFGRVVYYETGHRYTGNSMGTVYNEIMPGWVDFCKVGWRFDSGSDGLGWANQNTFIAGGITQSPVWGLPNRSSGWRHVVMDGGTGWIVHANTFVGASFEGDLSEYTLDLRTATHNTFIGSTRIEPGTAGLPATGSAQYNVLTIPGHSFKVGDPITFLASTAMPGGITLGVVYYVLTVSGNDVAVSATPGGAVVDITTDGAGVLAFKPPTFNFDNSNGACHDNVIKNYNSYPGPIHIRRTGAAAGALDPPIIG